MRGFEFFLHIIIQRDEEKQRKMLFTYAIALAKFALGTIQFLLCVYHTTLGNQILTGKRERKLNQKLELSLGTYLYITIFFD